jgi:precorrin-2 methylase
MKRIILGIALIAGVTSMANAQSKTKIETKSDGTTEVKVKSDSKEDTPEAAATANTAEMRNALHLSSTQYKQLYEVNLLVERKIASLVRVTDDKTTAMEELAKYKSEQYRQILSEDQYKKWSEAKK